MYLWLFLIIYLSSLLAYITCAIIIKYLESRR